MSDFPVPSPKPAYAVIPRQQFDEAVEARVAEILEATGNRPEKLPSRLGYVAGIPIGGATELNNAGSTTPDVVDRQTFLEQLSQAYLACPWASACVDVIARTCTAGGLEIVPDDEEAPHDAKHLPAQVQKVQDLLDFVNPYEDIRQLLRGAITDLLVYGDAFIEVQYLLGEPIALYSLDAPSMRVLADEHGNVTGFVQTTDNNQRAQFGLDEVIHISMDTPRGGLYGVSPTEKNLLPITLWIFTTALLNNLMKLGAPPRLHIDWPLSLSEPERKRQFRQYQVRNLGARNVGNPFETVGGANVKDLQPSNLQHLMMIADQARDIGVTGYGVPPSKVSIIESGNLGGGTGTAQDKTFRVNICGPVEELLLEKITFAIIRKGFRIDGWHFQLGEVDWRDDAVIEDIRDKRIRNATWTINKARRDIGEPEVEGGDDAVLVDRQNIVVVRDIAAMSKATVASKGASGTTAAPQGDDDDEPAAAGAAPAGGAAPPAKDPTGPGAKPPKGTGAKGRATRESVEESGSGAMVALFVPGDIARQLVVPDGLAAAELHLTLAYLGSADDLERQDELAALVQAWAIATRPIEARASGVGRFDPSATSDDMPVTYASIDAPSLPAARQRLVDSLRQGGFPPSSVHGFTPHVTLAYGDALADAGGCADPFVFATVTLAVGPDRQVFAFSPEAVESRPPRGPVEEAAAVDTAWRRAYQARRRQALRQLPRDTVDA